MRRWFLKLGDGVARNLRVDRPAPSDHWYLDEMVIVIRGKRHWLWRAVDNDGTVPDFLAQSRRKTKAAIKLMKSLLKKQKMSQSLIVTDKLRSYHAAFRELRLPVQRFLNVHASTYNHFDLQRHLINRSLFKKLRAVAFSGWKVSALNA